MSRIYLAWTSRRVEGGGREATLHCQSASLALVASFFHSSLRAGRTDDGGREGGGGGLQCTRTEGGTDGRTNERTNYRLHFLARNPARGSKWSHRSSGERERERRRRGGGATATVAARARVSLSPSPPLSVISWRCCSGIFQVVPRASRALVIVVNTLAKVTHERVGANRSRGKFNPRRKKPLLFYQRKSKNDMRYLSHYHCPFY